MKEFLLKSELKNWIERIDSFSGAHDFSEFAT